MHVYEDVALVALDFSDAMVRYATDASMDYSKAWHGPARFAMGEWYFNPHIDGCHCGEDAKSIQESIWDGLKECDEFERAELLMNIRVTSKVQIRGLAERLEAELITLATYHGFPRGTVEINVKTPKCWVDDEPESPDTKFYKEMGLKYHWDS